MAIDYPRTYFGWSATSPADYADPRSGLVIHYNGDATHLDNHSECVAYWKGVRSSHLGQGWADLGYSFGVDVEGGVFEGRGVRRYQAAQGTTAGNRDYYSVSLMIGGAEQPTAAQIEGVRRLRAWLMDHYDMADDVLGHRDFISTSCPGSPLYALVQDGTFTQPPGAITGGTNPLIGSKEGDSGEIVKAIQRLLVQAGQGDALAPYGVDGDWGSATSTALMLARQSIGSGVSTPVTSMGGETYAQLMVAMARHQVQGHAPACECDTTSGGTLPATETLSVSGKLQVKR